MCGTEQSFDIERFRGIVPDRVTAAVHNAMRNYGQAGAANAAARRRIDQGGVPLPGSVLAINEI